MKNPTQIRLYDIFRKDLHMPDDRAQNLVSTINDALAEHIELNRDNLATKESVNAEFKSVWGETNSISAEINSLKQHIRDVRVRMTHLIYLSSLVQTLAIVVALLLILFLLRK